jgi:hypothetical protein
MRRRMALTAVGPGVLLLGGCGSVSGTDASRALAQRRSGVLRKRCVRQSE